MVMDIWDILILTVLIGGGIVLIALFILSARYINVIYQKAFQILGFEYSSTHQEFFQNFKIGLGPLFTKFVFQGKFREYPAWAIYFSVQEDNNEINHYLGIIFQTPNKHESLHLYDTRSQYKTELSLPKKSESVEFDKAFRVFSEDHRSIFYEFSPSTMQDLLKLRSENHIPINIQLFEDKVLVYSTATSLDIPSNSLIRTIEVLTQNPGGPDIRYVADQIKDQFEKYYQFFKKTKL